jgi:6-phosphogluconolactonase (cycloisomerase 2 family)
MSPSSKKKTNPSTHVIRRWNEAIGSRLMRAAAVGRPAAGAAVVSPEAAESVLVDNITQWYTDAGVYPVQSVRSRIIRALAVSLTLFATQPAPVAQPAAGATARSVLYAGAGPELIRYEVQPDSPALVRRESVVLPGNVQYAWPHPSRRFLYVTWSNGPREHPNGVTAFAIDPSSGALKAHGAPVFIKARSIHLTTDVDGTHLLVAYNVPSGVSVHSLAADGTLGAEIPQRGLDTGVYAHQVRVHPANGMVILITRGNVAEEGKAEDPGALKLFTYKDGMLTNRASVAPGKGFGFQPRHLDFHPSGKWVYVSLEPQNTLQVYREEPDGTLGSDPLFVKDSLPFPISSRPGLYQRSGTVHVHPNGRFVYQADRATDTSDGRGTGPWGGGTNAIGVFAIDQATGEPTLIQNAETHGIVPRTFALDASARLLVAANQNRQEVRDGENVAMLLPSLALFRVLPNGKLDYVRKYEIESAKNSSLFWMGIVPLAR